MDAVMVKEFQFFGQWREPEFVQAMVFKRDMEFAGRAENLDRQGIKKFIRKNNQWCIWRECGAGRWAVSPGLRLCRH